MYLNKTFVKIKFLLNILPQEIPMLLDLYLAELREKLHRNECILERYDFIPERNEFIPNRNETIPDRYWNLGS